MKILTKLLVGLSLLGLVYGVSHAQDRFDYFGPVNGILKGSSTTYYTTAAIESDVTGLWSGSCSNVTYLRGDGTCATPPGTGGGTVNSVALAAPTVFSVSGSPVTNTGTLTLAFATGQTANEFLATPNGSTGAVGLRVITTADLPAIPLTSGVTGILPTANGGTGEAGTFTGVRKANTASADTAAVSADVYGLWSGTCSSATFLRGDGACAAPAAGSVTSVGLSWTGSGLTVTGSPVTSSGTIALSGTLNAASGGTGEAGTVTGVIKGNGTSAHSAAVAADVYGLWSGTCSSATFLRGDGSCAASGGSTGANPTALVGLTANNGTATTFVRSDASSALDQSISPTMTGSWTFTNGTAPQIAIIPATGVAGAMKVESGNTSTDAYYLATAQGAANWSMGAKTSTGFWEVCAASSLTGTCPLQVGVSGNVIIPAPGSGITTLTVNGPASGNEPGIVAAVPSGASVGAIQVFDSTNSTIRGYIGGGGLITGQASTDFGMAAATSGASLLIGRATGTATGTTFGPNGNVTINAPSSGASLNVTGPANNNAEDIQASTTASQSFGMDIAAGTNSSDRALLVTNAAASTQYAEIFGDGGVTLGAPTGGDKGLGSVNAQSAFVNNSAVCTANGTNCPGSAAFKYAQGAFAISGSSCSITSSVGIASCTWSSAGNVTVFTSAGFTSAATTVCVASPAGSSFASISSNTAGSSPVNINVFQFNAAGIAANASFNMVCFGT